MNLLITGANGYLGRALCAYLMENNHQIQTLTRQPMSLAGARNQCWSQAGGVALDKVDAVIHLAAVAHQAGRESASAEEYYWAVNVRQTQILAEAALAQGVKRFIYISSIKVNGEATQGVPFRYYDTPAPQDIYGRSKWAAEQALHQVLDGSATELVIIRPPLIWGGQMKGNLAVLQQLIEKGIPLPFASLRNRRDLVSIDNLCSLIAVTLTHPAAAGNTLLVSDGQARSTAEIIRLLAHGLARPARLVACPAWLLSLLAHCPGLGAKLQKLTGDLEVDIQPTRALLGWQPINNEQIVTATNY